MGGTGNLQQQQASAPPLSARGGQQTVRVEASAAVANSSLFKGLDLYAVQGGDPVYGTAGESGRRAAAVANRT